MIEILISSLILFLITPIFLSTFGFLVNYPNNFTVRQNNIGLIQLRRSLSLGRDHIIESDSICMNFNDDEMCFELNDSNLIATPGTQFFLINIDELNFEINEGWLYIIFHSLNRKYEYKLIRYEES